MQRLRTYTEQMTRALFVVFGTWSYWILAIASGAGIAALSLAMPVWFIPGNSLVFVLSLMRPENYAALIALASISGIVVAVNVYLIRRRSESAIAAGSGGASILASFIGTVLTTSCGCGIGFLLAFFGIGIGGASFLITNQLLVTLAALALALLGLFLSMRSIVGICSLDAVLSE